MSAQPKRQFTGKHMLITMVAGFGIVAAVNFYMASLAVGGFHGIVVDNSYVASQKFNTWIEEAEAMKALGLERGGDAGGKRPSEDRHDGRTQWRGHHRRASPPDWHQGVRLAHLCAAWRWFVPLA